MGSERGDQLDNRLLGGGADSAGAVASVVVAGLGSLLVGGLPAAGLVLVCVDHGGGCGVVWMGAPWLGPWSMGWSGCRGVEIPH